jgi:dephospho-CoA kinase
MMTMKIALIGKIRSGKDTLGDYLITHYGMYRFAFGDPLKENVKRVFPEAFSNGKKPRKLLQEYGQKMREIDPDVWINHTFNRIQETEYIHSHHVFISDARQPNEIDRLKAEGYTLIRVFASEQKRINRMLSAGDAFTVREIAHETEFHINSYEVDYEIDNNGTINETLKQLEIIMNQIGGK